MKHRTRIFSFARLVLALTALVVLGPCVSLLHAQGQTYLTGYVKDPTGAVIPGASVVITGAVTHAKYELQTDSAGIYRTPPLNPDLYDITISVQGFETHIEHGVQITVGQARDVDVTLQVGTVAQHIDVTALAGLLKTEDSSLGQNVTYDTVQSLPYFSRSAGILLVLAPGVRYGGDDQISYGSSRFSIAGLSTANVDVDGTRTMMQRLDIAQQGLNPSVETVSEERIVLNQFAPEFGKDVGALVQISTKSGTNHFHGGVYEYLRNNALDTYNGFTRLKPNDKQNVFGGTAGGKIIKDKLFYFVSFESWKAAQPESDSETVPTAAMKTGDFSATPYTIYDPSTTCGTGANAPCALNAKGQPIITRQQFSFNGHPNVMNPALFDPVALKVAAFLPNPLTAGFVNNANSAAGRYLTKIKGTEKFDYNISDNDRLMFEWLFDHTIETDNGFPPWDAISPAWSPATNNPGYLFISQAFSVHMIHTFSPTMFLSTQFAYRPYDITRISTNIDPAGKWAEKVGVKNYAGEHLPQLAEGGDMGAPYFNFAGYTGLGASSLQFKENPIKAIDDSVDLTFIRGKHTFKGGWAVEYSQHVAPDQTAPSGSFGFARLETGLPSTGLGGDPIASFLLGLVDNGGTELGPPIDNHSYYHDIYFQDDFKVRSGLTINLGMRYDMDAPVHIAHGLGSNFVFNLPNPNANGTWGSIVAFNSPQYPYNTWYQAYWHEFRPRLGLAWQVLPKTVIRGGWGMFTAADYYGSQNEASVGVVTHPTFASPDASVSPAFILQNGIPNYSLGYTDGNAPYGFGAVIPGQNPQYGAPFTEREWKKPVTMNGNLSLERQLTADTLLEIAGQTVAGRDLNQSMNYNEIPVALWGIPGSNLLRRPYPQYSSVSSNRSEPVGTTNYWGGYIKLTKKFSHDWTLISNYNYGRSLGVLGGRSIYLSSKLWHTDNIWDLANGLGSSVPYQIATIAAVYQVPVGPGEAHLNKGVASKILGGWIFSPLITLQGGEPYGISSGIDSTNGNSPASGWVNIVGDPKAVTNKSHDNWFNKAAFAAPVAASGQIGNFGTTHLRGPKDNMVNLSIRKVTPIGEKMKFTISAEAYNMFNTLQFGQPNGTLNSSSFGRTTGPPNEGGGIVIAPYYGARNIQVGLRLEF